MKTRLKALVLLLVLFAPVTVEKTWANTSAQVEVDAGEVDGIDPNECFLFVRVWKMFFGPK